MLRKRQGILGFRWVLAWFCGAIVLWASLASFAQPVGHAGGDGAPGGSAQPNPMLLDQNGDGKISRSEASGRIAKHFDVIDGNGDGFIDRYELLGRNEDLSSGGLF